MMGVRDVFGQGVEFCRADGTDGGRERSRGGRGDGGEGRGMGGVTGGCFEGGETGGEGYMKERGGGEGEELVMGLHEEVGQVGPAGLAVEVLHDVSLRQI